MANSYTLLADLRAGRCSNTAEVRLLRFWEARNTKKGGELMSVDMLFVDEQSTLIHGTVNTSRSQTAGRCSNTAEVRLLRFWEARNTKKGGELMSVDMLFVDEQSTLIHGTVNTSRSQTYRQDFNEGSIYSLSGFDVTRSNNNFRLSDAPVSVRFGEGTRFTRVTDSDKVIPTEMFRFRSYDQLLALANTNRQLPDILGELTAIRSTISDGLHGSQRVMLTLCVERGLSVCVSLFDGLAYAFHEKMTSYGAEPKVVLVTSINPKIVGGRLFLNGTSATHVYFDTETNAASTHLFGDGLNQTGTSSKLHAQKIEPITLSELNQYVLTADPQTIEFLCTARVTDIQREKGWCYIGCAKLADQTDDAVFVAFDMEMVKLTNIQASEAVQILGVGVDAHVEDELPQFVADIVGKTFTFQLKLGEFNFTSKHQTFTISRIFTERQHAPLPAFVGDGHDHGPDDVIPVQNPVAHEVSPDTSTTVIEQAGGVAAVTGENPNANYQSSSSAVPGGPLGSSKQIADPNENGKKKARLE
ncbi:hypothetical protein F2Q68_00015979 [Brassica cretica]|uniref:Replication protein A 70 kDa DNA-binding subunit B/D first OB fold domain-containing protein n=1 Tax=Brassica cretica TaxID=69181 RepID=A0A8S9HPX5_BRACR|nr:hypothetical protein F2Q68_00015979 [Brassica cretica]